MLSFEKVIVPAVLCGVIAASIALSQDGGQRQEGQRDRGQRTERPEGERGERQRGNFDPEQARQRMAQAFKEQLKVTDDEWAVLQPKLERVQTAQRQTRGGMGMMGGGFRGGREGSREGGGPGAQPEGSERQVSDVERTSRELRTALQNESTTPGEIQEKLKAYREARVKAQGELTAAREDLKQLLTQRQEAVLVTMGVLE